MPKRWIGERVARFRQVALDQTTAHHDALEFANGEIVLLTGLVEGQIATVLQLPHGAVCAENLIRVDDVMESPKLAE